MGRRDEKPAASKYENPFSELQVVMQQKIELQNTFSKEDESTIPSYIIDNEKFWQDDGEEVLDAVGPLIRILLVFDSFFPNIGYFYEPFEKAEETVEYYYVLNPKRYEVLWDLLRRIKGFIIMPIHVPSAFLNPGYMRANLTIDNMKFPDGITYMDEVLAQSEAAAFKTELEIHCSKDSSLFTDMAMAMLKIYHPGNR